MFISLAELAVLVFAGFKFGVQRATVRWRVLAATALLAISLYTGARLSLPYDAIERVVERGDPSFRAQLLILCIAMLETVALWLPVAVVPWSTLASRTWLTMCLIAAAALAARAYYYPFDVVIMNGEVMGPRHPQYGLGMAFYSVFGVVAYFFGRARRVKEDSATTA